MFLYLDTTTNLTKIVLYDEPKTEIKRKEWISDKNQSEELLSVIDSLLDGKKNSLSGIFVNIGPGSYTGQRVGITTANFLGFAQNIQPQGVFSENGLIFQKKEPFETPIVPVYKNKPVITKRKDGPRA